MTDTQVVEDARADAGLQELYQLAVAEDDGWPCLPPADPMLTPAGAQHVAQDIQSRFETLGFEVRVEERDGFWQIRTGFGEEESRAMSREQWEAWLDGFTRPLMYGLAVEMAG